MIQSESRTGDNESNDHHHDYRDEDDADRHDHDHDAKEYDEFSTSRVTNLRWSSSSLSSWSDLLISFSWSSWFLPSHLCKILSFYLSIVVVHVDDVLTTLSVSSQRRRILTSCQLHDFCIRITVHVLVVADVHAVLFTISFSSTRIQSTLTQSMCLNFVLPSTLLAWNVVRIGINLLSFSWSHTRVLSAFFAPSFTFTTPDMTVMMMIAHSEEWKMMSWTSSCSSKRVVHHRKSQPRL